MSCVLSRVEDLALCPIPLALVQADAESLMTAAKLLDCELSLVLCSDAFIAPLKDRKSVV